MSTSNVHEVASRTVGIILQSIKVVRDGSIVFPSLRKIRLVFFNFSKTYWPVFMLKIYPIKLFRSNHYLIDYIDFSIYFKLNPLTGKNVYLRYFGMNCLFAIFKPFLDLSGSQKKTQSIVHESVGKCSKVFSV